MDLDGTPHYSNIAVVTQQNAIATMQIVPNPVRGSAALLLQLPKESAAMISVTDMTGKLVALKKVFVWAGSNTLALDEITCCQPVSIT